MTKKVNIFMGWSLGLAGLLIAVLYSPVGSPDLYASTDYNSKSLNFAPYNATIANAPKMHAVSVNAQDELNIPELSSLPTSNRGIEITGSKNNQSNGSFIRTARFASFRNSNTTSNGMAGSPLLAGGRSRTAAGTSAIIMTNGITTLSVTSGVNNTMTQQNTTDQINATGGLTDPGGEDPFGNTIPVGDGWGLLVFFGVCYVLIKRYLK